MIVPRNHISLGIKPTADVDNHRWPEWFPAMLVMPHPLYPDRLADRLREKSRIRRGVVCAVVPVTSRRLNKNHANISNRDAEQLRDRRAKLMRSLGP